MPYQQQMRKEWPTPRGAAIMAYSLAGVVQKAVLACVVQAPFPLTLCFVATATYFNTHLAEEICTDTWRQDAICDDTRRPEG